METWNGTKEKPSKWNQRGWTELEPKNFIIIWRGVHVVLTTLPSMDWAGTWHTPDALKPFWHAHFEPNAVVSFFPTHVSLQLLCTLPWAQTMGADRASIVGKPSRVTPLVVGLSIYSQLHHLEKGPRKFIRKQMWHMVFLFGCSWALALRPTSSSRCGQGPSCIPGLFFFEVVIDPPWIASVGNQVDSSWLKKPHFLPVLSWCVLIPHVLGWWVKHLSPTYLQRQDYGCSCLWKSNSVRAAVQQKWALSNRIRSVNDMANYHHQQLS